MKINKIEYFSDSGNFIDSDEFAAILEDLKLAIESVVWHDAVSFVINPTVKGNGVTPIKKNFIKYLESKHWLLEKKMRIIDGMKPGAIDVIKHTSRGVFAVEWETGNISSSHRALSKMALGIIQKQLIGGILVLPVRNLAKYLTDRIGNYEEIAPYFHMYKHLKISDGILGVIAVDYDFISYEATLIPKGKDGNAKKPKKGIKK